MNETFPPDFDALSAHGATLLAVHVRKWWAARGYAVRTWRVQINETSWGVRSSLVDGLPPVRRVGLR